MEITTKSFQREVIESDVPVFIECWASWCLPCKQVDPSLERLSVQYRGRCKVLKINIDRNPKISERYTINGLPTFLAFVNGKEIERRVGAQTDNMLIEMIENAIKQYTDFANGVGNDMKEEEEQRIIEERLKDLGYM